MIVSSLKTPTELWVSLGLEFFKNRKNIIDLNLGNRRFVSVNNVLTILDWPKEWSGKALYELVGYSPKGTKMDTLRNTYVDPTRWIEFKHKAAEVKKKGYSLIGMQFNMKLEKKGGCLSSLHLLQNGKENTLFIQGKVAEMPRKFTADLILVRDLVQDLGLWPMRVHFMYSTVYYSIVNLRAYVPVFGKDIMKYAKDIPILEDRNYHKGTIERLSEIREDLMRKHKGKCILELIKSETGDWK